MNSHEYGLLAFLEKQQRRRIEALLDKGTSRRAKFRAILDHGMQFNQKFVIELKGHESFSGKIAERLNGLGAPSNCFVMSANVKLDYSTFLLTDARSDIVSHGFGSFISCVPAVLGYYESEHRGSGIILFSSDG